MMKPNHCLAAIAMIAAVSVPISAQTKPLETTAATRPAAPAVLPAEGVLGVTPLPNGNILITDRKGVQEINHEKQTVWELTAADVPDYKLENLQLAWRLPNGNTLFNCWVNEWNGKINRKTAPVQAIEVTADKRVVWALRAWTPPVDLGPATTIQILDNGPIPDAGIFGDGNLRN